VNYYSTYPLDANTIQIRLGPTSEGKHVFSTKTRKKPTIFNQLMHKAKWISYAVVNQLLSQCTVYIENPSDIVNRCSFLNFYFLLTKNLLWHFRVNTRTYISLQFAKMLFSIPFVDWKYVRSCCRNRTARSVTCLFLTEASTYCTVEYIWKISSLNALLNVLMCKKEAIAHYRMGRCTSRQSIL
jgi:hypothetical protein